MPEFMSVSGLVFWRALAVFLMIILPNTSHAAKGEGGAYHVLAFGDSLTAGYGLPAGEGFVDQLQIFLAEKLKAPVQVTNAGVSGDTTSGGLARFDWALAGMDRKPDLILLELGANDGLRGIDPDLSARNLALMIEKARDQQVPLLLLGMRATPNWGAEYSAKFDAIFPTLARDHQVAFYPFFLEGVAADPDLNQADGIHPNQKGVKKIIAQLGPQVAALVMGAVK